MSRSAYYLQLFVDILHTINRGIEGADFVRSQLKLLFEIRDLCDAGLPPSGILSFEFVLMQSSRMNVYYYDMNHPTCVP